MAVESLPKLPAGIDIFLDANVFIYAFGGQSKQCLELLFRCAREEVYGVTTIEAINEVTHRLMLAEMLKPTDVLPILTFSPRRSSMTSVVLFSCVEFLPSKLKATQGLRGTVTLAGVVMAAACILLEAAKKCLRCGSVAEELVSTPAM